MTTTGLVLGKFLPPHIGHEYLVNFAEQYVDELTVVVGTIQSEPIPGALRYQWMTKLFPHVKVLHLTDENPQYPHEHPDFWNIWKQSLLRVLGQAPDYVFASEDYGWQLADTLGATFIPCDLARSIVPISATQIRMHPFDYWQYIPSEVRPYYVKRVCIFGPESTGKSTLTTQLAEHFTTIAVPEYARGYLQAKNNECVYSDMENIARGQLASERVLCKKANKVLFSDTDILATQLWSDTLFDKCPAWIKEKSTTLTTDLTLLLDVDVPWVADPIRYYPEDRHKFFERCEQHLIAHHRPYEIIRGTWSERFQSAVKAVNKCIST